MGKKFSFSTRQVKDMKAETRTTTQETLYDLVEKLEVLISQFVPEEKSDLDVNTIVQEYIEDMKAEAFAEMNNFFLEEESF